MGVITCVATSMVELIDWVPSWVVKWVALQVLTVEALSWSPLLSCCQGGEPHREMIARPWIRIHCLHSQVLPHYSLIQVDHLAETRVYDDAWIMISHVTRFYVEEYSLCKIVGA